MTATAKQFVAAAASQIGYHEGRDANGNWNNDNKYGIWYGMNRVAWCAIFDSWVANQVGALGTLVPKFASCFAGLQWFRKRGQTGVWPPKTGDIFILCEYNPGSTFDTGNGWATIHTGIVEKFTPDSSTNGETGVIQTIEGNTNDNGSPQGDGVYRLHRSDARTSNKIIYCRPAWAPEPVVTRPPVTEPSRTDTRPPIPKPAPAKPIPGSTYSGSRTIDVSTLEYAAKHPGYRSTAAYRWNGLVWAWLCKNSPNYAKANLAAWQKESAYVLGREGQRATQEMYRVLNSRSPKIYQKVSLPCWPGPLGVKAIGGTPV